MQSTDEAFPSELWLGVSRQAVSLYKRGEPWPLEVFPYEQILSFGAPLPNAYKIAVEGRELLFETPLVRTQAPGDSVSVVLTLGFKPSLPALTLNSLSRRVATGVVTPGYL